MASKEDGLSFPSVGLVGRRIWNVGRCRVCGLAQMWDETIDGPQPVKRTKCSGAHAGEEQK